GMRRKALATRIWLAGALISIGATAAGAADLIWQVENPFRFFKSTRSFALHEAAFNSVRGNPSGPLPADIIWRVERKLNDLACKDKLTIARVPYSLDPAHSGVSVTVKLPDGRDLADRNVVVEDLFVVALGDSFASGESNPDRPVQFSGAREMVYDPALLRDEVATRGIDNKSQATPSYGLAAADDQQNPKVLPRRLMEDELAARINKLTSPAF